VAVLLRFSVDDLEHLSRAVRAVEVEEPTMVGAAAAVTRLLHRELVMVRLYVTQPFRALPENRRELARSLAPDVEDNVSCLVTLATNGDGTLPEGSRPEEHVLPFTPLVFERIPLMAHLLEGVGIDMEAAVTQERAVELRLQHRTFNAYLESNLADNEALLPDPIHRQVVRERGINSMLALAGVLPTGGLMLLLLQTNVELNDAVVSLLQPLATAVKAALIPYSLAIFEPRVPRS
jgi:hypothetical protein